MTQPNVMSDITSDMMADVTSGTLSEASSEPSSGTLSEPSSEASSDFTAVLAKYMSDRNISSFRALSKESGLSRSAIDRLRRGQVLQMQVNTLLKLANFLKLDLETLVRSLTPIPSGTSRAITDAESLAKTSTGSEAIVSEETFQRSALQTLEPWLLQWSAVATAAQNNPQMSAANLLPLLRPIDVLMTDWGVTAIGHVGELVDYDPTEHQMMDGGGMVQAGDRVRVRFAGYRYQGNLLHRAKVSLP